MTMREARLLAACVVLFLIGAAGTWFILFTWLGGALPCPRDSACDLPMLTGFALGVAAAPIGGGLLAWLPGRALRRVRQERRRAQEQPSSALEA